MHPSYEQNVFINCPFDQDFRSIVEAIIFTVHDCGFAVRSALETDDGSQVRISKIYNLIADCRFGVHDLSRTELDPASSLPRFNMPLELGIFLGAKQFGNAKQQRKNCLILDTSRYRYQAFCSDIARQDVRSHNDDPDEAIRVVRNWLRNATAKRGTTVPGAGTVQDRYRTFRTDLPVICERLAWDEADLIFNDYTTLISFWQQADPW